MIDNSYVTVVCKDRFLVLDGPYAASFCRLLGGDNKGREQVKLKADQISAAIAKLERRPKKEKRPFKSIAAEAATILRYLGGEGEPPEPKERANSRFQVGAKTVSFDPIQMAIALEVIGFSSQELRSKMYKGSQLTETTVLTDEEAQIVEAISGGNHSHLFAAPFIEI